MWFHLSPPMCSLSSAASQQPSPTLCVLVSVGLSVCQQQLSQGAARTPTLFVGMLPAHSECSKQSKICNGINEILFSYPREASTAHFKLWNLINFPDLYAGQRAKIRFALLNLFTLR